MRAGRHTATARTPEMSDVQLSSLRAKTPKTNYERGEMEQMSVVQKAAHRGRSRPNKMGIYLAHQAERMKAHNCKHPTNRSAKDIQRNERQPEEDVPREARPAQSKV